MIISMIFSEIFYTIIVDINFGQVEVPFKTYEDLDKSQLHVYTISLYYDQVFRKASNQHIKNIKYRTHLIHNIESCVEWLESLRNLTCIMTESTANYFINKPLVYHFEEGSLYVKRFLEMQRRLNEAGIAYKLKRTVEHGEKMRSKNKSRERNIDSVVTKYFLLFLIFIHVSILVFVGEIIYAQGMNNRRSLKK